MYCDGGMRILVATLSIVVLGFAQEKQRANCPFGLHVHHANMEYDQADVKENICEVGEDCMIAKDFRISENGSRMIFAACLPSAACKAITCTDVLKRFPNELFNGRLSDTTHCSVACCNSSKCRDELHIGENMPMNNKCVRNEKRVEQGRKCRNACSSDDDCKKRKRCRCDGWCGMSCMKPDATCDKPELDADESMAVTIYGKNKNKLSYDCNDGSYLVGEKFRVCLPDKKWSGVEPTCTPGCKLPGNINPNTFAAALKTGYSVDESVHYFCNFGYVATGDTKSTCQPDFSWSPPYINCVKNPCGEPPDPKHRRYREISLVGDGLLRAYYDCIEGHESADGRQKEDYIDCERNGKWSKFRKECAPSKAALCPDLKNSPRRIVTFVPSREPARSVGTSVVFSCVAGYKLVGTAKAICTVDKVWSDKTPVCRSIRCPPLKPSGLLGAKLLRKSRAFKSKAEFSCPPNYELVGAKTVTCTETGEWSDENPICEKSALLCPRLKAPENGDIQYNKGQFKPGEIGSIAQVSCFPDYRLIGEVELRCMADGQWSNPLPICAYPVVSCPQLKAPDKGDIQYKGASKPGEVGSIAYFSCSPDYRLIGEMELRCMEDGQWSNPLPTCALPGSRCPTLVPPENSNIRYNAGFVKPGEVRSIAYVFCFLGYRPVGDVELRCQGNGEWSHSLPTCTKTFCGYPILPDSVLVKNSRPDATIVTVNTKITFQCKNEAMTLFGDRTSTCIGHGVWSNDVPICGCPVLKNTDALFHDVNKEHTMVTFECDNGYNLLGARYAECLENGAWSQPQPKCIERGCMVDTFLLKANVRVKGHEDDDEFSVPRGEKATLTCKGSEIVTIECQKRSSWSEDYSKFSCDKRPIKTTPSPPATTIALPPKTKKPIEKELEGPELKGCGIGGYDFSANIEIPDTQITRWPWQVLVLRKRDDVDECLKHVEGGATLISDRWVLSAASIFYGSAQENKDDWEKEFIIGLGIGYIPDVHENLLGNERFYEPIRIILHKKFESPNMANDICLIKIGGRYKIKGNKFVFRKKEETFEFNEYIRPVCLPCLNSCKKDELNLKKVDKDECDKKGEKYKLGETDQDKFSSVVITGFGYTKRLSSGIRQKVIRSNVLQKGTLLIWNETQCDDAHERVKKVWKEAPPFNPGSFCATSSGKGSVADSCYGDSGGPLVRRAKSKSGDSCWYQIGIVSWSQECVASFKDTTYPGFYTDIFHFIPWISKTIRSNT